MRNVICDGNGSPRRSIKAPASCGWTGERKGTNRDLGPLPFDVFSEELRREMEAKPCPRCGGRVRVFRHPLTGKRLP